MATKKVKAYRRRDGSKVKAHIRKRSKWRSAGDTLRSGLEGLVKSSRGPRKPKKLNLKRDLNKLTRTAKRKNKVKILGR